MDNQLISGKRVYRRADTARSERLSVVEITPNQADRKTALLQKASAFCQGAPALGRLPRRGERIDFEGFEFAVIKADKRRIDSLQVQRQGT